MNRRLVVAIVLVALGTGACSSAEPHASRPRAARPSPAQSSTVQPAGARPARLVRDIVEREVRSVWSLATDGEPAAIAADERGEVVVIKFERVGALDPRGNVLWVTDLDGVVDAVPVLTNDRVVVPFTRDNGAGGCAGFDRKTGELRWKYEAVVTGGIAVASAGALALCLMGNGQTAGIDLASGAPVWQFTYAGDADPSIVVVPRGTAIAVDPTNGVFAFVAQLGSQWQLTIRSTETGRTQVFHDLGSAAPPSAPVALGDGYLAVASAAEGLELIEVEADRFVSFPIPAADGFDPASPPLRVDDADLIVMGRAGEVTVFDLGTRRARWTAHAGSPLRAAHPVMVRNVVMVQTWAGGLVAFRLLDGAPVPLPWDPGRAIAMLAFGGNVVAFAVGLDGDAGWIERWEAKPGP